MVVRRTVAVASGVSVAVADGRAGSSRRVGAVAAAAAVSLEQGAAGIPLVERRVPESIYVYRVSHQFTYQPCARAAVCL